MSLSDVIGSFATDGNYAVSRPSTSATHVDGRYVPGTPTVFSVTGSIQPVGDQNQLLALPEARRVEVKRVFYTQTALSVSDILLVEGETWEAVRVEHWEFSGDFHYKAFLARRKVGLLAALFIVEGGASFTASAELTADGATAINGAASFDASAELVADGELVVNGGASFDASAELTADGAAIVDGGASFDASAELTADGFNLLLMEMDFSAPVTAFDFSSAFATDEWLLQELAGAYSNNVGSETLSGGIGFQGQEAIGVFNGTDYVSRKAWECNAITQKLSASGTTAGDSNNQDFCFRVVFRVPQAPGNADYLISKRDGAVGWSLIYLLAGDEFEFTLDDGPNVFKVATANTVSMTDGGWHYITGWYDASAQMMYIKTSVSGEQSTSTAGLGTLTNANPLVINGFATSANAGTQYCQYAYGGVCVGANSQSMYDEAFWSHATDPSGELDTIDRSSLISVPVASDRVSHFGDGQLPIGFHSDFAAGTYGLYCNSAVTNLIDHSELPTGWALVNCASFARNANAPDGMRRATRFQASAAGGYGSKLFTTVASTKYTLSVWLQEQLTSRTGRIVFYDESNGSELASVPFTTTATWTPITLTATTNVGQVSSSFRIEIDDLNGRVLWWGAQATLNESGVSAAYVRTNGATASLDASEYSKADAVATDEGELLVDYVRAVQGGASSLTDQAGGALDDARQMRFTTSNLLVGQIYHGGSLESLLITTSPYNPVPLDQLITSALQWGSDLSTTEMRVITDGTKQDDEETLPYEFSPSGTFESLMVGSNRNAVNGLDGFIQSIKSYRTQISVGV